MATPNQNKTHRKRITFILLLTATWLTMPAQQVLLHEMVKDPSAQNDWGPNRKHFGHWVGRAGGMAGSGVSAIPYAEAAFFRYAGLGYQYKVRIWSFLHIGAGGSLKHQTTSSRIKSNPGIQVSNWDLTAGPFLRIRFGQKGDYLGYYVDAGTEFSLSFASRLRISALADPASHNGYENIISRLKNHEAISAGSVYAFGRIGIDRLAFIWRVRLPLSDEGIPEAWSYAKQSIGVELALTRY